MGSTFLSSSGVPGGRQSSRPQWLSWAPSLALSVIGLAAAYLSAFASGKLLLLGFGLVFALCGVLIAGYNAFGMVVGLLVIRSSLDWFVAARSGGGATPVSGVQPALLVGGATLAVAAAWLIVQIAADTFHRPSPMGIALILFAGTCIITSLGSDKPLVSLSTSFRVLIGATLFLMVEQLLLHRPNRYKAILAALGASMAIPAAMSVVQFTERTADKNYVTGPFVHQNSMAIWLSVLIPVFLALVRYTRGSARLGCLVATGFGTTMLLFTYCRSAWIGVTVAFVVVAALQERRLLIVLALLIASIWAWVPSVGDRLSDLDDVRIEGQGDPNSFAFRQRYWHEILATYVDGVPLEQNLTGIGLGMVEEQMPDHLEPHNVWVQIITETGVLGTITFAGFIVTIAVQLGRGLRRAKPGVQRGIIVGVAAAGTNMLVQSVSQNLITEAVIWTYLATVLALGAVMTMVQTRELTITEPAAPDLRRRGINQPALVLP